LYSETIFKTIRNCRENFQNKVAKAYVMTVYQILQVLTEKGGLRKETASWKIWR